MDNTRAPSGAMLRPSSHALILLSVLFSQVLVPCTAQFDMSSWTEWSAWSHCPATCGPDIHTRVRQCRLDNTARGSGPMLPCRGVKTQRKACQTKPCPGNRPTAHEVACNRYNSRVFSGRRYVWEPFTHPPSPCKLACRARGQHFYANLGGRVQDGTSCGQGTRQAVCDGGVCKKTGCDGIIGSAKVRDKCGVCQGDGSSCSTISGIFTSTSLRRGLNDVISIPAGSTNINITELEPSRNLLLIQTFQGRTILTGGSRSPVSGEVAAAGTVFTYSAKTRNIRRASIFSPGPTNVGVKLKLLLRDRNPGIQYTFNVGANTADVSRDPRRPVVSRRLSVPTSEDAIRDRLGVSGLQAGPEPTYPSRPVPPDMLSEDLDSSEETSEVSGGEGSDSDEDESYSSSEESEDDDLVDESSSSEEDEEDFEPGDSSAQTEGDEEEESERFTASKDVDDGVDVDVGEGGEDEDDEGVDLEEERDSGEEDEESLGDEEDSEEEEDEEEDDEEYDEGDEEDDEEAIGDEEGSSESFDDKKDIDDDQDGEEQDAEWDGSEDDEEDEDDKIARSGIESRGGKQSVSNTQSDERVSSDTDEEYRIPKYSQSFNFGKRYKSIRGDSSPQRATRQRPRYTAAAVGGTRRSGKMVRFGLKYVDDESGKTEGHAQTLTVGGGRYPPSGDITRGTYNRAYITPGRSGSSPGGVRRRYQTTNKLYAKPRRRTQQQHTGTVTNNRREDLLRRQRQREAAREERRRQERERRNRQLREYQERSQRRQELLAERRRVQKERYNQAYPRRQGYSTAAQSGPRNTYSRRTFPDREQSSPNKDPITDRKQSTRGPVIRHYGEDGLYASGQKVRGTESTPESVEIFRNPDNDISPSDSIGRPEISSSESRPRSNTPSSQPRIIPRLRAPKNQEKPKIISRVAQPAQDPKPQIISRVSQGGQLRKPVDQSRQDIIPRIRTPGTFDNTGGRRPSVISALGGDGPSKESRDIIPNSAPAKPRPLQPVDRTIDSGRGSDVTAYIWRISGFTECTKTCGGGVQQTVVVCVDTTSQAVVTDENCRHVQRPDLTAVKCNTRMCPAQWSAGPWSACSASCGGGHRTRTLICQARVSPTLNLTVDNSSCADKQTPVDREECGLDPCNSWRSGNWSQCSARCGEGVRTRPVQCVSLSGQVLEEEACSSIGKPRTRLDCDSGPCGKGWFYQEWPQECPVECGEGEITRQIFCSGEADEILPEERCDPDLRPETRRKCRSARPCGGHWFTGPWSKCETACGAGNRTRAVLCIKSLSGDIFAPVDPENCLASEKPAQTEPCELEPCRAQWFMTSWSQCSKSCGTGYRSRGVMCLNPDHTASDQCALPGRPKARDACNTQTCRPSRPSRVTTNETSGPEPSSDCEDQFVGCRVVKKARLCRYKFYKEKCCKSCSEE